MRLELKAIKKEGILFKIGQSLLLVAILSILYFQLSNFRWSEYTWSLPVNYIAFCTAVLLVFFNWILEFKKWQFSIKAIGDFDQMQIRSSFYGGMISGFLTPSALGNFIGRMIPFTASERPRVVSHTLFGNGAQLCVSLFFGAVSLVLISDLPTKLNSVFIESAIVFIALVALSLYFTIEKFPFLKKLLMKYVPSFTKISFELRWKFLGLSAMRYLVFSFQFYLVILAFAPNTSLVVWFWIWNLYLWTTLSPSLFFGKLFIRETMAIFLLTEVGVTVPVALISSLIIWFLNNVLPSLFAYFKLKQNVVV